MESCSCNICLYFAPVRAVYSLSFLCLSFFSFISLSVRPSVCPSVCLLAWQCLCPCVYVSFDHGKSELPMQPVLQPFALSASNIPVRVLLMLWSERKMYGYGWSRGSSMLLTAKGRSPGCRGGYLRVEPVRPTSDEPKQCRFST